jgi:hypothetical protein
MNGFRYPLIDDDEKLIHQVVEYLAAGKVVGWFQGSVRRSGMDVLALDHCVLHKSE